MRISKIGVVGAGAIGCYYGGMLARAGFDVRFLMRGDLETVRERGLLIRSGGEEIHLPHVGAYGSTSEMGECDLVIVAVKATSNGDLPGLLEPLLGERTPILTLQNGLGNEAFLAEHFGERRVMGGLCFVCLNRVEPGVIEHYGHGTVSVGEYLGGPKERTHAVVEALSRAGIEAKAVEDLANERWRKLVWNVPFNGLTIAAGGVGVDRVIGDPAMLKLTWALMNEVVATASALGHEISPDFLESRIGNTRRMGDYKPSSLVDFIEGRAVEIEAIWGGPLRVAAELGVAVPRLEMLHTLLVQLTAKTGARASMV